MTPRNRCIIRSCIKELYNIENTKLIIERLMETLDPDPEPITAEEHQAGFNDALTKEPLNVGN